MSGLAVLHLLLPPLAALAGKTPFIDTTAGGIAQPTDFSRVSGVYIPYNTGTSFGFGMGAAEQVAFDHVQKYAYAVSEQGAINVIDLANPSAMTVMNAIGVDLAGTKLTDIEVCSSAGILLVGAGAANTIDNGKVHIFSTVQRSSPQAPAKLKEISVGPLPDMVLPNSDCSKVAVANEGEGDYGSSLVDPQGSVDILELTITGSSVPPSAGDISLARTTVSLAQWTDSTLISLGVHLPLPLKAMEYFDDNSKWSASLDFGTARQSYNAAMNLEPEYLAWSADGSTLYVNLQENNAIVTINAASSPPAVRDISALGLKDHSAAGAGLDIVDDSACTMATYTGFKALRMPDAIQAVQINGETYILTANEGDDKGYGAFEEKQKLKDVVDSDGNPKAGPGDDWENFTITASAKASAQAVRAAEKSMRISMGSSAVDYSDATAPQLHTIVALGGRGMSIYKDQGSGTGLTLHWDSGSQFEEPLCAAYPWSHNGIQDEEFAPTNGVLYNSSSQKLKDAIDEMNDRSEGGCADGGDGQEGACPLGQTKDQRSAKDGSAIEAIVAGKACGSLLAVTATEKTGVAFVYDITNIAAPELLFVKHLSPASETKNPGVAYAARELGEVDPEAMIFLEAEHSPSGKPGVLFAGAWSGTMSFWDFTCPNDPVSAARTSLHPLPPSNMGLTILISALTAAATALPQAF